MNSAFSNRISFNEKLDLEAKTFAICIVKILNQSENKIFGSK